jgi:hypothetical protein
MERAAYRRTSMRIVGADRHFIGIFTECGGGAEKQATLRREHARVLGQRPP